MQKNAVVCVATFVAKDGKADELLQALSALVEPTRQELGCLRYEPNQNLENPSEFVLIEKFVDRAAFDLHSKQPYLQEFAETALKKFVVTSSVKLYQET